MGAPTGIDRVESAYLDTLLAQPEPLFGLVRTRLGYLLLDRGAMASARDRLVGAAPWGAADTLGHLARRRDAARAGAETDLRRIAAGRASPLGLARLLRRRLPKGSAYLNVGQTSLAEHTLRGIRAAGLPIAVMIHDTIPLDHPEFAVPGVPDRFRERLAGVARHADLVICNSRATLADTSRHMAAMGRVPPMIASHLGTDVPSPDPATLPDGLPPPRPYFVALGTIEPRKNIGLLLDVWERLAADPPPGGAPALVIVGRRGWRSEALFARLDASPLRGTLLFETGPLPDGAVAALLAGAAGLLFPSFAEGWGMPPLEAAALGVPVLCGELAIYRESLGDYPVYADVSDRYLWQAKIVAMTAHDGQAEGTGRKTAEIPGLQTWADHFKPVLRLT